MGRILYLGTDPSRYTSDQELIHLPLIHINPLPIPDKVWRDFETFTHIILTSPNAARILIEQVSPRQQQLLAIGMGTASVIQSLGLKVHRVANPESQEGMINLLNEMSLQDAYLFYPRSSRARPLLTRYLQGRGISHQICDLYETIFIKPADPTSLDEIEEIVFTSPSTVHAFIDVYGRIPKDKKLTCIGAVTHAALLKVDR